MSADKAAEHSAHRLGHSVAAKGEVAEPEDWEASRFE